MHIKKGTVFSLVVLLLASFGLWWAYHTQQQTQLELPSTPSGSLGSFAAGSAAGEPTTGVSSWLQAQSTSGTSLSTPTSAWPQTTLQAPTQWNQDSYAYAKEYGILPAVTPAPRDPYLLYVSKDYALPTGYSQNVKTAVCVPKYPEKKEMEQTAAAAYLAMYDAAFATGADLVPYSGYRSTTRQKNNFDNKILQHKNQGKNTAEAIAAAATSILPPGCSEHEAGLAMDITRPGVWDAIESFKDTKEFAWLQAHAHEFGFVLRYPQNKVALTGVKYEPWHWRYVGKTHAAAMRAQELCLEEYLKQLGYPPLA